jgi:hypothetical protein
VELGGHAPGVVLIEHSGTCVNCRPRSSVVGHGVEPHQQKPGVPSAAAVAAQQMAPVQVVLVCDRPSGHEHAQSEPEPDGPQAKAAHVHVWASSAYWQHCAPAAPIVLPTVVVSHGPPPLACESEQLHRSSENAIQPCEREPELELQPAAIQTPARSEQAKRFIPALRIPRSLYTPALAGLVSGAGLAISKRVGSMKPAASASDERAPRVAFARRPLRSNGGQRLHHGRDDG